MATSQSRLKMSRSHNTLRPEKHRYFIRDFQAYQNHSRDFAYAAVHTECAYTRFSLLPSANRLAILPPERIGFTPLSFSGGGVREMLVVETVTRIRHEYFVKGKLIKEIVRDLGVSRNIASKVLRSGETVFAYGRIVQPLPKRGPSTADLNRLLETNDHKARRERLMMIRVFEESQAARLSGPL